MKIFSLFLLLTFTLNITAQISISKSDLPQAGKSYYRSEANNPNIIDVSETGANHLWDYTELSRSQRDTLRYDEVSQTPSLYQFLFNNPIWQSYQATEALATPDVNIGGLLSMTNNYLFSKQTNSEWNEVGIGTTISSIPLPTTYDNIKTKLKLPLTYQDTYTDDYSYLIQIPTVGATGQDGTLSYIADGWGTLQLPGGTYDVIRVKTEVNKSDTLYLSLLSFGFRFPSNEVVYEWYAIGEGFPVLTVTESAFGLISTVTYSDNLINGIEDFKTPTANKIYPNPVQNTLQLELNSQNYSVSVFNLSGELVISPSGISTSMIDVSSLSKGIYFVKIQNESNTQILRFIKQ